MSEAKEVNAVGIIKWFQDNKKWIYPVFWFVVGYFGLNPENIPTVPGIPNNEVIEKRFTDIEQRVDVLTKAVAAHEEKLFPLGATADSSAAEEDKPTFRN